jgi:dienelactone hydrolase
MTCRTLSGLSTLLIPLVVVMAGCPEDIQVYEPAAAVEAVFDPSAVPPAVPTPTDLVKNRATGLLSGLPAAPEGTAQGYFDRFLQGLDGFPTSATAEVRFKGTIDAKTVSKDTVLVFDISTAADKPTLVENLVFETLVDETKNTSMIRIGNHAGWKRGTNYAFFVMGGSGGVKGTKGALLVRSAPFEIATAPHPLCAWDKGQSWSRTTGACEPADPGTATGCCTYNYSALIESTVAKDVREQMVGSSEEEVAMAIKAEVLDKATQFEQLRRGYTLLLPTVAAASKSPDDVVVMWNFTTVSMTEVIYDPTGGVIPFPNNLLLDSALLANDPPEYKVKMPASACQTPTQQALCAGLNTLDGFTTTGSYFAPVSGKVDAASLEPGVAALALNLTTLQPAPLAYSVVDTAPAIVATPTQPLDEKSMYGIALISKLKAGEAAPLDGKGLKDDKGRRLVPSVFTALLRSKSPLLENGKSTVSAVDDATAALVEPARLAFKPLFDGLEGLGVVREDVVAAWTFRTQSITEALTKLRALPWQLFGTPLGDNNQPKWIGTLDSTLTGFPAGDGKGHSYAKDAIGGWVPDGLFVSWNLIDEQGSQAFHADPLQGKIAGIPFWLTLPKAPACTMPADGWPVVVFQHGTYEGRPYALYVANTLAQKCFATVAFDIIYHGDRSWCTEDAHCAAGTCNKATGQCPAITCATSADCVAKKANGGRCDTTKSQCVSSLLDSNDNGIPDASGQHFINPANPFAIRDNMRQHVIDAAALLRGIKLGAWSNIAGLKLDSKKVEYAGQSLGSILGTLVLATDSLPQRAALAGPGAPFPNIAFEAPGFKTLKDGLLKSLGITEGSLEELQVRATFNWILDPADPGNFAAYVKTNQLTDLVTTQPVSKKEVLIQLAEKDQTVPKVRGDYLAQAMGVDTQKSVYTGQDHLFLYYASPDANATKAAQSQMSEFLSSGTVCTPDLTNGTCN